MKQIARKLSDGFDGFLEGYKYLIHDRAPCFSQSFRTVLKDSGVKPIRLPRKSPNLNAFAERWVRTAKELCVHRMIFFGERSLRHALSETVTFYNQERPHQAMGNKFIQPQFNNPPDTKGKITCRSRLGGMLNHYYRNAA